MVNNKALTDHITPRSRVRGYVYLPLELKIRELDSKAAIATRLVSQGFTVIFGQQWAIFRALDRMPQGAILFKGYHKIFWPAMKAAKTLGYAVFAHDEEWFIHFIPENLTDIIEGFTENLVDVIFPSGPAENAFLSSKGINKTVAAGNPRLELLGASGRQYFASEIDKIKADHGDFILINTNFCLTNPIWNSYDQIVSANRQAGITESLDITLNFLRAREENALNIIDRLIEIDNAKTRFVIRPHPGETLDYWNRKYGKTSNVLVIREGHHVPWTAAASALIHSGCLTGIEAQILGTPSYNIAPNISHGFSQPLLTDSLSNSFSNASELWEAIKSLKSNHSLQSPIDIQSKVYGSGSEEPPSVVIARCMAAAAESKYLSFESISPALEFGKDVPQLEKKCNLNVNEVKTAITKWSRIFNIDNDISVTEITNSLFVLHGLSDIENSNFINDARVTDKADITERTTSTRSTILFAENLWAKGELSKSIELLKAIYDRGYFDGKFIESFASKLLRIGLDQQAILVYSHGLLHNPKNIRLNLGLAKAYLESSPQSTEEILNPILQSTSAATIEYGRIICEVIEYAGFARRSISGQPPHHALSAKEIGFSDIRWIAEKFAKVMKSLWSDEHNRNETTYELTALSLFATGGLSKLKQFLPKLAQISPLSVWSSVHHWDTHPQLYSSERKDRPGWDCTHYPISEKPPSAHGALLMSCDSTYYNKFGIPLILSLKKTSFRGTLYVHIMHDRPLDNKTILNLSKTLSFNLVPILEDVSHIEIERRRVYYHLSRFFRLEHVLAETGSPIFLFDVDSLFKCDPSSLFNKLDKNDVAYRARSCRLHPWNVVNASVVGFAGTQASIDYLSRVANYLQEAWTQRSARWGIDQAALYMAWEYSSFSKINLNIKYLDQFDVDYDYHAKGVVWQNSGLSKFADRGLVASKFVNRPRAAIYDDYLAQCISHQDIERFKI